MSYPRERDDERPYIGIRCEQCGKEEQIPEDVAYRMEGPFLCSERCEDAAAGQREQEAAYADFEAEAEDDEPAPAPPWTLREGRLLCYDGMSVARLYPATADDELAHPVAQLDDLASLFCALLNGWGSLDSVRYAFPVPEALAGAVRDVPAFDRQFEASGGSHA